MAWFGADHKPTAPNVADTPVTITAYDEGMYGLATSWWTTSTWPVRPSCSNSSAAGGFDLDWGTGGPDGLGDRQLLGPVHRRDLLQRVGRLHLPDLPTEQGPPLHRRPARHRRLDRGHRLHARGHRARNRGGPPPDPPRDGRHQRHRLAPPGMEALRQLRHRGRQPELPPLRARDLHRRSRRRDHRHQLQRHPQRDRPPVRARHRGHDGPGRSRAHRIDHV